MDNIGMEAYALCCLLPLIAFLTLAAQIFANTVPKDTLRGRVHSLNDDFLCGMQGLITITEDHRRNTPSPSKQCAPINEESEPRTEKCNDLSLQSTGRRVSCAPRREPLTGCSAGLARMKLINQRYLGEKKETVGWGSEGRLRRVRRTGRQDFKPTYLPVIVEGLQY